MLGEELDKQLGELHMKINLLANILGYKFEYDWDGVSGIKKKEEE